MYVKLNVFWRKQFLVKWKIFLRKHFTLKNFFHLIDFLKCIEIFPQLRKSYYFKKYLEYMKNILFAENFTQMELLRRVTEKCNRLKINLEEINK